MVRVRFAPSPTGFLHQGNIRTALFNFLFAKQQGGQGILRIDDTDPERSKPEFESAILNDLKWLGLSFEEGPSLGGPYAPYRQSERHDIYQKYLDQLLAAKKAYACFSTPEEIEMERRRSLATGRTFSYRGKDRNLSQEEVRERMAKGEKPHYRFAVDREIIKFKDKVYGEKIFDSGDIGDFVIARSDGSFLYLYSSAIDDCLMNITHVIRGEDGMSNTPRQILIQKALGFSPPAFAHLPLILGPDHSLLSKRNGSASVAELKAKGYLQQALLNYLALLGWSPPGGKEILPMEELIRVFDLSRVSRSSAIFDWAKLNHINFAYLRKLSDEEYLGKAREILRESETVIGNASEEELNKNILALRPNVQTLGEIPAWLELLLGEPKITSEEAQEVVQTKESEKVWKTASQLLSDFAGEFDEKNYQEFIQDLQKKTKVKGKKLFMPLRVALTGHTHGPELVNLFKSLGKTRISERIHRAAESIQHPETN